MSKLTRGPLVLYHLPNYWSRKKLKLKMLKKFKKKIKKHNFKIIRAHVYPQTTSKMPISFRSICLKLWEELFSQGTYYYMHFHSIEAWQKSMLKVKMWEKLKNLKLKDSVKSIDISSDYG